MGQKANPIGNRLGIIRGWDSNWFADKDYGLKVVEDEKIRNYLRARRPKTAQNDPRERNKPMQNGSLRLGCSCLSPNFPPPRGHTGWDRRSFAGEIQLGWKV